MIHVVSHRQPDGELHWGRLSGNWGLAECDCLLDLLDDLAPAAGSRLVLDCTEITHIHYRAVPVLLAIARGMEARRVTFQTIGLSDYLKRIVEVACAQSGRDFHEGLNWVHPPLLGHAGALLSGDLDLLTAGDPHGLTVPSLN